ncbi:hypothetical protein ONE63_008869 [Megalurothrips usitatus]|uniref:Uncharacterized protein n=1 Tax=Megalurothrips usitatus TaxID=439358 RepID=A0AAV7XPP6_9NEOP|nr:hypothetical protein ONE63_008869 [Megalurothrips usitatus]
MDSGSRPQPVRDPLIEQISINRRISNYKECCFRCYAIGLAALSIATSVSYFSLKRFPLRDKQLLLLSGCVGSVVGYLASREMSKECNLILKAHRESMHNPVSAEATEENL